MTTYEHAMVGVTGLMSTGLHRKYDWQLVLLAGIAAISPDWDALPWLVNKDLFELGHRVWGHNIFVALLVGALIAWTDYQFEWTTKLGHSFQKRFPKMLPQKRSETTSIDPQNSPIRSGKVWMTVCLLAALSHLLADLTVSGLGGGTEELEGHWELQLLWPLTDQGWIFPLIRWGDPTPTILFALGMLALAKSPQNTPTLARLTLLSVCTYMGIHGAWFY